MRKQICINETLSAHNLEQGVSSTAGSEGEDSHSYASLELGEQGGWPEESFGDLRNILVKGVGEEVNVVKCSTNLGSNREQKHVNGQKAFNVVSIGDIEQCNKVEEGVYVQEVGEKACL